MGASKSRDASGDSIDDVIAKFKEIGLNTKMAGIDESDLDGERLTIKLRGSIPAAKESDLLDLIAHVQNERKNIEFDTSAVKFVKPKKSPEMDDDEVKEIFSADEIISDQVKQLAAFIKESEYMVVHTGAGISTSAKIPDFRGPNGVWTRRDRGMAAPKSIPLAQAIPTFAHKTLVEMQRTGIMKYLISQNVDGLHRRSGIREDMLSELHGNCFREICASCKTDFLRDYSVTSVRGPHFKGVQDVMSKSGISHITGRKCDNCEGMLRDSVIHFSENLPQRDLYLAEQHSKKADLVIVIGSSLRVSPACNIPLISVKKGAKLVILNLQPTPLDDTARESGGFVIHGKSDEVMQQLVEELKKEGVLDASLTIE